MAINVVINGRVVKAPEKKEVNNSVYYTFLVVTNDYVGGKTESLWINVVCSNESFARRMETLKKGSVINLSGKLHAKSSENKGVVYTNYIVRLTDFDYAVSNNYQKKEESDVEPTEHKQEEVPVAAPSYQTSPSDESLDDLPF